VDAGFYAATFRLGGKGEHQRDPDETRANSQLDYNDAKRALEPPAERRACEHRDNPHPNRPTAIKNVAFPPKDDS